MSGLTLAMQIEVPLERAVNCIIGGLEGGYSPWLHAFLPACKPETSEAALQGGGGLGGDEGIWYSRESFWAGGGMADLVYDLATEPEGEGGGKTKIGLTALIEGLRRMALIAPRHFSDLVSENDDAITHDVFMQMMVFGEIVYG